MFKINTKFAQFDKSVVVTVLEICSSLRSKITCDAP